MKKVLLLLIICAVNFVAFGQTPVAIGFENSGAFPPTGWTTGNSATYLAAVSGTGGNPTTTGPHGGTYYCRFNAYSLSGGNTALLISPVVDWSGRSSAPTTVTIWWWRDVASYNTSTYDLEGVTAYVNTSKSLTGATSMGYVPRRGGLSTSGGVSGTATTTTSGWFQYTFTVPTTFNSATNYIIFQFYSKFGNNCFMDDVAYTTYPGCTLSAITGSSISCVGGSNTLSNPTSGGTWSSSVTTVAIVNATTGVVTGVATGNTNIVYVAGGCSATLPITVNPSPVVSGSASPSTICAGGSSTLGFSSSNPGATYTSTVVTYAPVSFTPTGTFSSATTPTSGSNDDGYYAVNLPFSFSLFGTTYAAGASAYIGTNGYVTFGSGMTNTSISTMPNTSFPATISLFGRDMIISTSGSISYGVTGTTPNRIFLINYNAVPDYSSGGTETGQIAIYETSGNVELHVTTAQATTHTLGIQSASGASALTVAGQNYSSTGITNTSYRFALPVPSFVWTSDPTLSSTTSATPTAGPIGATKSYTITATASNGCSAAALATVTVSPSPTALTGTAVICQTAAVTLSSSAGGTWATSNASIATVGSTSSSTATVTGVNPGTATITYAFGASCYVTQAVTVLPTSAVVGSSTVCPGLMITLSNAITGGTWTSANTTLATVDAVTGVLTGVAAGSVSAIYTLPTGCARNKTITVNPLPAPFTGGTTVCKGLSTTISESSTGGAWSSSATAIATVGSTSATTGVVLGASAGTAVITYTLPTSCIMTASVLVNPLPSAIISPAAGSCITDINNAAIALVDSTPSGNWTSSNSAVATILSTTGLLTSLALGTTTITYTLPTTCINTTVIKVNPLPAAITGTQVVCANATTYLGNSSIGGVWASSNTTVATVGSSTGIVRGIAGSGVTTYPVISYTLPTGCLGVATVTVNPFPGAITGTRQVCEGAATTLTRSGAGTWSTSNSLLATVAAGVVSGVSTGIPRITFTLNSTGCFSFVPVTVNAVPAAITPASVAVCYGQTITLNNATAGGTWSSSSSALATVSGSGIVSPVASSGLATISYTLSTGCAAVRAVSINPVPVVYNLTTVGGVSNYCSGGSGIELQLNGSVSGNVYTLYRGGIIVPGSTTGTGSTITFGNQTAAGVYTAMATSAAGCTTAMSGSPSINIDPLPAKYTLKSSGSAGYCAGSAGVAVYMDSSQNAVNYSLFNGSAVDTIVAGTGSRADFHAVTAGTYTAVAEDQLTHCKNTMKGSVVVVQNVLPTAYTVSVTSFDSGYYCEGTAGAHVIQNFGSVGIRYDLYNSTGTLVATALGANSSVDYGVLPTGTYTAIATNTATLCTNNMNGSAIIVKRPAPVAYTVSGTGGYCAGGAGRPIAVDSSETYTNYYLILNASTVVGTARPGSSPAAIAMGTQTTAGTYTVLATNTMTGCSSYMKGNAVITVYPALTIDTVKLEGNGSYCAGGAGLVVSLSGSSAGVKYDLYNSGGSLPIQTVMGTGSGISFPYRDTLAGIKTVLATSAGAGGCTANMYGTPLLTINPLPAAKNLTVSNGGNYCIGSAGVNLGLDFSDVGVTYQLYKGGVAVGSLLAGAGSSLDYGLFTTTGTYTIIGTNTSTTCAAKMNGSAAVTVNAAPTGYNVTGGGSYCAGSVTGRKVGLFTSALGISYQLYRNGVAVNLPMLGTGAALDFGNYTALGLYTITGTDVVTGCTKDMNGSVVITTDPLPVAYNVTGGGDNCAGGAGFNVGLDNSVNGVSYQLYNGSMAAGIPVMGISGRSLDFGIKSAAGAYTVVATTIVSGCTNDMNGTAVINVNPLPTVDTVKGGGAYCAGDAGAPVYMSGSLPGVYYQLYKASVAVGSPVSGTGAKLDLGLHTVGSYSVVAYNAATGCTNNMVGAVNVTVNPQPTAYAVTGGGTMCEGGAGFHVYLAGSKAGVSYELYKSGVSTGVVKAATGMGLDFGAQTAGGNYTVIAANTATGCVNTMSGSAMVNVDPAPAAFTVTNGGHYCAGGTGVPVGLIMSQTGVNYQLYNGASPVGMMVGGTGSAISFGLQTAAGSSYTVTGTNAATTCTGNMAGSVVVVPDVLVTPSVKIVNDTAACVGDVIHYSVSAVNEGAAPSYVWKIGGAIVSIKDTFTAIPAMGDKVVVTMTSSANCLTAPTAADAVIMNVTPYVMPEATVTASPSNNICGGTAVTMSVVMENGGTAPVYAWMKNGVFVGKGSTYSYTPTHSGNNGDVVTFMLNSKLRCRMADTVFSTPIVMTVDTAVAPDVTLQVYKNVVAVGQVDSFAALTSLAAEYNMAYQWYVQGVPVLGATAQTFVDKNVYNNDEVMCEVTKLGACGNQTTTKKVTVKLMNLGTQQVNAKASITIVPNPNKGEFSIKGTIGNTTGEVDIEIANMMGQAIYKNKVISNAGDIEARIKLSNTIANGMYLLSIRAGNAVQVFHVVVEQ